MNEERVVLTAELKDEASAPLENLAKNVEKTTKKVESGAKRQSTATRTSTAAIGRSVGGLGRSASGLGRAWDKLSGTTSRVWGGMSSKVRSQGSKIIAEARKVGDKSGKEMSDGFSSKVKGMFAGALAGLSVGAALGGANAAVGAFSSLEDASGAAEVVFGKHMDSIIAQSKTAAAELGMSESQVIDAANTFGTYGKSAGLAGGDLAGFSTEMTQLAGDMASFKGTDTTTAIDAISQALRGENEGIRQFGVMLDDATLKDRALKMGLISTTKDALTPANKVLAAQQEILAQTTDAQGDFARTSKSTANVQKTLAMETENLKAKVGGLLAPAFTAARLKATDLVRGLSSFIDRIKEAQAVFKAGGTNMDIAKALGLSGNTAAIFSEALGSIRAFRAGMSEGGEVTSGGVAGVFERIGIAIFNLKQTVAGFGAGQWAGVAGGAALIVAAFTKFGSILPMIVAGFMKFGPVLGQLGGALRFLLGPIGLISMLFIAAYSSSEPFRAAVNGLLGTLLQLGMTLMTALMPVLTQLMTAVLPIITSLFTQLVPVFVSIITAILPLVTLLITQLVPIFVTLIEAVLPIVMTLISALAPIITQLLAAVTPLIPPIVELAASLLNLAMSVITPLMPLVTGIAGLLSGVLIGAIDLVIPVVEFLVDAFTNLVGYLEGPLTSTIDFVSGLFSGIGDIIGGVVGGIGDFIGGVGDALGLSGGGVVGGGAGGNFAGGGVVHAAGGLTLGGYRPGRDTVPAMLSPGESVLVPELTRAIGPRNIMAANREASGGRPAGAGPGVVSGFSAAAPTGGGTNITFGEGSVRMDFSGVSQADAPAIYAVARQAVEDAIYEAKSRAY